MIKIEKRLLFVTLNRIVLISSLHYTTYILHCLFVCLSHCLCTIYHVPYATLSILILLFFILCFIKFFSTCPYLYICNSCIFVYVYVCMYVYIYIYIYIYLICTYLYFSVLLLVFSVICMHQGVRE